jgi:hypothetical protein
VLLDDAEFRQLLRGLDNGTTKIDGRYGESYILTGTYNPNQAPILPGITAPPPTGYTADDNDARALWYLRNSALGFYGSPPDLDGNGVLGLDPAGQPLFMYMGTNNGAPPGTPEMLDEAFELDLSRRRTFTTNNVRLAKVDNPFVRRQNWRPYCAATI